MKKNRHFSSAQIIALGFLGVIIAGSILLILPIATRNGKGASILEALFTSVSSVCVTGLVVQDTATYWSMFGQIVILMLIQTGGMGVITIAVSIAMFSGKKIGLMQRSTMQEAISAPNMRGIVRLTHFILKITFSTEIIAAVVMAPVFCKEFGLWKGCWYSLFHSVSAFCNAGFDLMGINAPFSSLSKFQGNAIINITIILLIIWGGIGFLTWEDIWNNKWHFRRYRMQSKVILLTTIILIVLPVCYFYFVEFADTSWAGMSSTERFWSSFFQAVTPRTAGFNTVDLQKLSGTGKVMTIMLMLIGGSPGSTAGGMKTTTVAILIASSIAVFRKEEEVHYFKRHIAIETVRTAAAIFIMYCFLFLFGGLVISSVENIPVIPCLFETASAIGTVGLTLGITTQLSIISKLILIGLMFFGRVGGLTLIFAATSNQRSNVSKYPKEKITVG